MKINPELDPEIQQLLAVVQDDMSVAHTMSAVQLREFFEERRLAPTDASSVHEVTELNIPASHGNIPCRVYKPLDKDNLPVLVWFHGGGWVLGDLDSADYPCRHLAAESGCIVLSVAYRLAPEHIFPAAFDDCLTALQWTFNNTSKIGADKNRIAVGGDSAGGNLAACVCIAAKESKLDVRFQLLIYPVVEPDFNNLSYSENADGYFLTKNLMTWFWDQYVPDTSMRNDIRVMPIAGSLADLPPTWLLTAGFDPLRDEGIKYACALKAAGVAVTTAQTDDTVHGFFTMPVSGGVAARKLAAKHLKRALL